MSYIIKARNFLIEIVKMLMPVSSIMLVYLLNIKPLTFVVNVFGIKNTFTEAITSTAEAGFTGAIIALVISIIFKSVSLKNVLNVEIYDNYMEDRLIVPLSEKQSEYGDKNYKLYIKAKIKYSSILMKRFIEKQDNLMIKVVFPEWISYEIENEDDLGKDVIIEKSKNIFEINISNFIGNEQFRGNLTVKMELISSSMTTRLDGNVTANYYLSNKAKLPIVSLGLLYILRIVKFLFIFFKFNIKYVDKGVSTN